VSCDGLFDLRGRVVVLTGGAGLLGREYAQDLVAAGAHVVVGDVDGAAAHRLAADVGPLCLPVSVDVSSPESVKQMVEMALAAFGRIDALVNNAALDPKFDPAHAGEHHGGLPEQSVATWEKALAVNVTGAFLCCQAVAEPMETSGRGVIVNIGSIYGLVGPDQSIYNGGGVKPAHYSVSKAAMVGLTRYLAAYWAGTGIRVNTLTLGGVDNRHEPDFVERYSARTLMGRMACRNEYCGALRFLLSDASSYMTGANLVVDGGWTAW